MLTDFNGREIRDGNHIVYPVRQGAKLWLNRGIVLATSQGHLVVSRLDPPGTRTVTIRNLKTVAVVEAPKPLETPHAV